MQRTTTAVYHGDMVDLYDRMYPDPSGELSRLARFVAVHTPAPSVIEYGVATGRIAEHLQAAGLQVSGVDNAADMLAALAERPGCEQVQTHLVDFIAQPPPGRYGAVLIALNTLFVAHTLDQQIAVLRHAEQNLLPDGVLVVETFNPARFHQLHEPKLELRTLAPRENSTMDAALMVDQYICDPTQQLLVSKHTVLDGGTPWSFTHVLRYMFPAELDAVARHAGLIPTERYADWDGSAFSASRPRCITVYRRGGQTRGESLR